MCSSVGSRIQAPPTPGSSPDKLFVTHKEINHGYRKWSFKLCEGDGPGRCKVLYRQRVELEAPLPQPERDRWLHAHGQQLIEEERIERLRLQAMRELQR